MSEPVANHDPRFGPARLTVELINICNLHCSYCLRDEDALYHNRAEFISVELLKHILIQARDVAGITQVGFTGGEPTLYPAFSRALEICSELGFKASFITNGWHFEKLFPLLMKYRDALSHVSFSIDGATREAHDRLRGEGSFVRIVKAFSHCYGGGLPFRVKVGIRRDTVEHLEKLALFAARLGAAGINFSHLLPTSPELEAEFGLNADERRHADEEIALLARIFKMPVGIDVGYHNLDSSAPCLPLAGVSCNVDYKGRLTLCCNLSGYRGTSGEEDIVADLNSEDFEVAYARVLRLGEKQLERRKAALEIFDQSNSKTELYVGSPCLFCLQSFKKIPWHQSSATANTTRTLPVIAV
jgi:MoaA/NifB/PqqE/SkfB family radical SAM enzyme